jgi:hypothetical protein
MIDLAGKNTYTVPPTVGNEKTLISWLVMRTKGVYEKLVEKRHGRTRTGTRYLKRNVVFSVQGILAGMKEHVQGPFHRTVGSEET